MSQLENIIESFEKIFDYYFKITNINYLFVFMKKINLNILFQFIITPLTNNLKSQLAYCTFGCLKKLATF